MLLQLLHGTLPPELSEGDCEGLVVSPFSVVGLARGVRQVPIEQFSVGINEHNALVYEQGALPAHRGTKNFAVFPGEVRESSL